MIAVSPVGRGQLAVSAAPGCSVVNCRRSWGSRVAVYFPVVPGQLALAGAAGLRRGPPPRLPSCPPPGSPASRREAAALPGSLPEAGRACGLPGRPRRGQAGGAHQAVPPLTRWAGQAGRPGWPGRAEDLGPAQTPLAVAPGSSPVSVQARGGRPRWGTWSAARDRLMLLLEQLAGCTRKSFPARRTPGFEIRLRRRHVDPDAAGEEHFFVRVNLYRAPQSAATRPKQLSRSPGDGCLAGIHADRSGRNG